MIQHPEVYTYGHTNIYSEQFIPLLKQYGINCVVDCRPTTSESTPLNTSTNELKTTLKQNNISYLPFFQHFGFIQKEAINKRGEIDYNKIIQTSNFTNGIKRLKNGIEKGYTICIIDNEIDTIHSRRFLYIGKYLQECINIIHITPGGKCMSQQQIEKQIQNIQNAQQRKNHKAQSIGEIGEELATNYLIKNGYRIIDRNWNLHHGCELDIVAQKNCHLHFVEVKTRSVKNSTIRTEDIHPEIAIDHRKIKNISKAVQTYRYQKRLYNIEYQVDSIAIIYINSEDYELHHYLDISTPNHACEEIIFKSKDN